jgi:hypothetical protein
VQELSPENQEVHKAATQEAVQHMEEEVGEGVLAGVDQEEGTVSWYALSLQCLLSCSNHPLPRSGHRHMLSTQFSTVLHTSYTR